MYIKITLHFHIGCICTVLIELSSYTIKPLLFITNDICRFSPITVWFPSSNSENKVSYLNTSYTLFRQVVLYNKWYNVILTSKLLSEFIILTLLLGTLISLYYLNVSYPFNSPTKTYKLNALLYRVLTARLAYL